ncbi:hypothetical protein COT42_03215 [Candidatus Saganbacteria bacterium CG08_land_8_20_14_0_20_45_16]|uniref:Aminotransferase DegT n=1 Tax=Candidatus Saganbacteria bacterium CG08_land_8_20_14_0_20_45_16 TaxID=2014293 RepID=A0A2H0XZ65_UNCSA|nr:MAG: hypothetical protein COT42_03215 [Candidatus Saganbacteria bacterium CG08_land_8_20_14_0_20_45_16]
MRQLFKSVFNFVLGKRNIGFYFATLNAADSFLALFYSFAVLLGLPIASKGGEKLRVLAQNDFGDKKIFFYVSARSALYGHLKCLGFEPGSEVIVTGFTCEVVPNAVVQAGLKPVYIDINPANYCMDPKLLKEKITNKSRVLIIQHTFGIPAQIDELLAIAREHNLYVIEDCAVSLGTRFKGELTGTFGDAAIFSFELSKTITSCRGGMLLINTDNLNGIKKQQDFYEKVPEQPVFYASNILLQLGLSGLLYRPVIFNLGKYLISFLFKLKVFKNSTSVQEEHAKMPENYLLRLSGQQAEVLVRQWKKLDKIIDNSKKLALVYYEGLRDVRKLSAFPIKPEARVNLIRYPILVDNRQDMLDFFWTKGIELDKWFAAPLSSPIIDHSLFGYTFGQCPVAEKCASQICNLPTNLRTTASDARKIVSFLLKGPSIEYESAK